MQDVGPVDSFIVDRGALPLEDDELLLGRDVLDTQIVDAVGHLMARVSDVLLTRLLDGRLEVAAVDVGMGAFISRLGIRWLSERLPEQAVDWRDVHLTSARGHAIQLTTTVAAVHRLDALALAELLTRLDASSATDLIRRMGPRRAAAAVALAHPVVAGRLMLALHPDDAAKVIDELPSEFVHRFRDKLSSRLPLTRLWRLTQCDHPRIGLTHGSRPQSVTRRVADDSAVGRSPNKLPSSPLGCDGGFEDVVDGQDADLVVVVV
jgi:hypothetical protein